MTQKHLIIDAFAGGGGASVGIEMALGRTVDIAINHDPEAIRMHMVNHPDTLHLTEDIFKVDLQKYIKGRHVALMWASPDCTSHSKAKGGKPREAGLRILPWAVYKHAKAILPDVIIMENVEEIQQWGPLDKQGYPIKEKKGQEYEKFISHMKSLGYDFDSRELVAADYGAPTTRKRWYAIFRRDGKPIVWPEPTHNKNGTGGLKKWVAVSTVLDFSDLGKSIFGRKKPLADNTMKRIARGLNKFVFGSQDPFIINYKFCNPPRSCEDPLTTITAVNNHYMAVPVVAPYMVQTNHGGNNFRGQGITEPMPTITQKHGFGKVVPYIMQIGQTGFAKDRNRGMYEPLSTIVTKNEHCVVSPHIAPMLIQYHSEQSEKEVRGQTVEEPVRTIDTSNRYGAVMAFLMKYYHTTTGQSMLEPIHTITTSPGHFGQVSVLAVPIENLLADLDLSIKDQNEINDVIQKCTWVSEFIIEYYGRGTGQSVDMPLHTVVSKDKFALITVLGNEYVILDIFLRMLTAEELKLAQGFPKDYIINRDVHFKPYPVSEQVKRIGNSVVPVMAQKLVEANCPYLKVGDRMPNMSLDYSEPQVRFA
ncbi:MAG: DNA cytosine methyltransferase [Acetatifactor sp.]|nr:DNA cytosine methyltransferase [Acetatifactor sp.]